MYEIKVINSLLLGIYSHRLSIDLVVGIDVCEISFFALSVYCYRSVFVSKFDEDVLILVLFLMQFHYTFNSIFR